MPQGIHAVGDHERGAPGGQLFLLLQRDPFLFPRSSPLKARVKGIDNSNTKQRQAMCHLKGAMILHERHNILHNILNEERRLSTKWS